MFMVEPLMYKCVRVIKTEFIAGENVEAEGCPSYSGGLGEIRVQPRCMVFNAPYMFSQKNRILISNDSNRPVAIRITFSNPHRHFVEEETEIIRSLDNIHQLRKFRIQSECH
ncbi:hypothetical protein B9Z55_011020 [Caenorhabditis nigoni]|uniref:MSP domain-containing protein n=1 Tax=Caenorhabditis nigoni TaxID=1611254 RepID=A0A2G5UI99_9PELO|nr:hypothetical protein B9Z55_011020 [Caenorhabditis nigoni]